MSIARRRATARRKLDRVQWQLLVRAVIGLASANLHLSWWSFERAVRFGAIPLGRRARGIDVETVVWAVRAAARRVPFRAMCIEQGIAAQRLMRRAGIDARLHYGARPGSAGEALSAHVWVSVDGEIVLGGEEAAKFAEVAAFP